MSEKELKHGQKSQDSRYQSMGRHIWCSNCGEWIVAKVWYLHKDGSICDSRQVRKSGLSR